MLFSFLPYQALNPVYLGFASVLIGLVGQSTSIPMAVLAYSTRKTTKDERTMAISIIEACTTVGETIGYLINAFVFDGGKNYYLAFSVQIAVNLYSVVYIIALVPDAYNFHDIRVDVHFG